MAVEEALISLASTAAQTVVTAVATDAWEAVKRGFARLLGRGDLSRTELAERRLEQVREDLTGAPGDELEGVRDRQIATWQTRLLDVLEEHPEITDELRALVNDLQTRMRTGTVSADGPGVAAGRDVNISASGGGIAAGTIRGNVMPTNPTLPGPANR